MKAGEVYRKVAHRLTKAVGVLVKFCTALSYVHEKITTGKLFHCYFLTVIFYYEE